MPFAGFEDFEACVRSAAGRGVSDPKAYCAAIEREAEKVAKASGPLAGWSPEGVRPASGGRRAVLAAALTLNRELVRILAAQRRWISVNWERLLSPEQRVGLLFKQRIPPELDPGDPEFDVIVGRALEPGLGRALDVGGTAAADELRSRYSIGVDWNLANDSAITYVRRHGLELARNLRTTTIRTLRREIAEGLRLGEPSPEIRRRIMGAVRQIDRNRARLIAQTETIRAQAEGTLIVGREAGIERKRWLDLRPRHCPLCAELHGVEVGLGEDFPGGIGAPPRHPGCQCALVLVVEVREAAA